MMPGSVLPPSGVLQGPTLAWQEYIRGPRVRSWCRPAVGVEASCQAGLCWNACSATSCPLILCGGPTVCPALCVWHHQRDDRPDVNSNSSSAQ